MLRQVGLRGKPRVWQDKPQPIWPGLECCGVLRSAGFSLEKEQGPLLWGPYFPALGPARMWPQLL